MSLYLVAGQGASTTPMITSGDHLSTDRPRRYPSDTSDAEWEITAPFIPVGGTRVRAGGRPVAYARRDIVDAIRYLDHNSVVWRALPVDFPPWRTVYHYFRKWDRDGTLNGLHNGLREQIRLAEGRAADPSAAILDSQSVRAAETVAQGSRGYDGGKKINGRKRHIAVDTGGLLLMVLVTGAAVHVVTRYRDELTRTITVDGIAPTATIVVRSVAPSSLSMKIWLLSGLRSIVIATSFNISVMTIRRRDG